MLNIYISKSSKKFLKKLLPKHKKQIYHKIKSLADDPFPSDSHDLKGYSEYIRADIGEYRIIYFLSKNAINIEMVGKRNDDEIYRKFKRLF